MKTLSQPKIFILQFGALVSLYFCILMLVNLLFGVINISFPDDVSSFFEIDAAGEQIRLAIATLVIFVPTYFILTRFTNQVRRQTDAHEYHGLVKWLIYLSLLCPTIV